jgi:hypothetical protein
LATANATFTAASASGTTTTDTESAAAAVATGTAASDTNISDTTSLAAAIATFTAASASGTTTTDTASAAAANSATNDTSVDVVSPPYLDRISTLRPRKSITNTDIEESSNEVPSYKSGTSTIPSKDIIVHLKNTKLLGTINTPKRPKIINLDTYESTKQCTVNDDTIAEDEVSHDSSLQMKNSFFKKKIKCNSISHSSVEA